jgi:hypothetical protein
VLRCRNDGSEYDESDVQWTCTASLPAEYKLGSTDVICEGYSSPDDSYILAGSCGVEYRLILTEQGKQKHGSARATINIGSERTKLVWWENLLFWAAVAAVIGWVAYSAYTDPGRQPLQGQPNPYNGGDFWGGGGGGGGPDDPPPPYPGKSQPQGQQQWRPGFWSGAATGAAAGYAASSYNNSNRRRTDRGGDNAGEGSSRSSGNNDSGSGSGARHSSTGFGGTSRR